jgi:hypothetical protein
MALAIVINIILSAVVLTVIISLAVWGIRGSRAEGRARAVTIARGRARARPAHARSRGDVRFGEYAGDVA